MFCPRCGEKEEHLVQYCRTCGTDLRAVREGLERPDLEAVSIASAREEIARAAAAKIKEGQWWQVGVIVPEVEKLFESPQERRLRLRRADEEQRLKLLRGGTITAAVGLGMILLFLLFSLTRGDALFLIGLSLIGLSLIVFLVGLGVIINGLFFTVPKQSTHDHAPGTGKPDAFNTSPGNPAGTTSAPTLAHSSLPSSSITEQTTRHLSGELVKVPQRGNSI